MGAPQQGLLEMYLPCISRVSRVDLAFTSRFYLPTSPHISLYLPQQGLLP